MVSSVFVIKHNRIGYMAVDILWKGFFSPLCSENREERETQV